MRTEGGARSGGYGADRGDVKGRPLTEGLGELELRLADDEVKALEAPYKQKLVLDDA